MKPKYFLLLKLYSLLKATKHESVKLKQSSFGIEHESTTYFQTSVLKSLM